MKPKTYLLRRYHRMRGHINYRGLTFALDPQVVTDQILDSLRNDDYKVPEFQALSGLMRPGDRVLELGAGLVPVVELSSATVVAFERVPTP